ncbi:fibronectin type III-like domain-contianing protein [Streptomyces flavofungini]|uniref:fibronectin type III-like domain-contianing protein n=1 Tax=Streptomyces flavofungini TaxID=68200 RepID=UPI0034E02CE6
MRTSLTRRGLLAAGSGLAAATALPALSGCSSLASADSRSRVAAGAPDLTCRVTVRNAGTRPAHETVQLYVRRVSGATSWPRVRELRGFVRLDVDPGRESGAVFSIDADTLASVGRDLCPVVEPGTVDVETGPASDRTRAVRPEIVAGCG